MTLSNDKQQYQKEQDELLKVVLNERFFKTFHDGPLHADEPSLWHNSELEIYITNACNQHCEYCYFVKYPELYDAPKDSDTLKHNLRLLLDYFYEHQYVPRVVDLFSGEIWHTQLGLDILEIVLKYVRQGWAIPKIMICSNGTFLMDQLQLHKIQNIIDMFAELGVQLQFSFSVDGKYIDEQFRPRNNNDHYLDDFYDTLFAFAKHNTFYFHPMVSSKNVKYWIENLKWWIDQCDYYGMDLFEWVMMLEVRNPDWTEESIQEYNNFMDKLLEYTLHNYCNDDKTKFLNTLLGIRLHNSAGLNGYIPYMLNKTYDFTACSICGEFIVRLGDLAICPCHRTAYNKYLYGNFVVEDDKIVDIHANNPTFAIQILMANHHYGLHGCDTCLYKDICLRGCFGAQLEALGDPLFPLENVCMFFKAKYSHLLKKYEEYGAFEYAKSIGPQELRYEYVQILISLYEQWRQQNGMAR